MCVVFASMFDRRPKVKVTIIHPNGWWCMRSGSAPADPGPDEDPARGVPEPADVVPWVPVVTRPDWMTEEDLQACLDAVPDQEEPWWQQEGDPDPDDDPPPLDCDWGQIDAEG